MLISLHQFGMWLALCTHVTVLIAKIMNNYGYKTFFPLLTIGVSGKVMVQHGTYKRDFNAKLPFYEGFYRF